MDDPASAADGVLRHLAVAALAPGTATRISRIA
jgi:hypothetical protein